LVGLFTGILREEPDAAVRATGAVPAELLALLVRYFGAAPVAAALGNMGSSVPPSEGPGGSWGGSEENSSDDSRELHFDLDGIG